MQLIHKNVTSFIYYIFVLIRVEGAMILNQCTKKESARILGQAINCIHSHVFCLTGKIWHSGSQIRVCRQRHASKQDVGTVLSNYSLCLCSRSSAFNFTQCCGAVERHTKACAIWILGVLGAGFLSRRKPVGSSVVVLDGLGILQGWGSWFYLPSNVWKCTKVLQMFLSWLVLPEWRGEVSLGQPWKTGQCLLHFCWIQTCLGEFICAGNLVLVPFVLCASSIFAPFTCDGPCSPRVFTVFPCRELYCICNIFLNPLVCRIDG